MTDYNYVIWKCANKLSEMINENGYDYWNIIIDKFEMINKLICVKYWNMKIDKFEIMTNKNCQKW